MPLTRRTVLGTAATAMAISVTGGSARAAPPLGFDGFGFLRVLLINFKDGARPADRAALAAGLGEGTAVRGFLSAENTVPLKPGGYAWGTATAFADKAAYEAARDIEAAQLPKFATYSALHLDQPFFWVNPAHAGKSVFDRHYVLIRFKEGVDAARKERVISYIQGRVVGHPNIQSYLLGQNILPRGPTSRFDWLAATTFPSAEDHRIQRDDPARRATTAVEFLPFADIENFDCMG